MSGKRRYHEPQVCPDCGKTVATLVPWHGDGSLVRFVAHGPIKARCTGSRKIPPNNAHSDWPWLNTGVWRVCSPARRPLPAEQRPAGTPTTPSTDHEPTRAQEETT